MGQDYWMLPLELLWCAFSGTVLLVMFFFLQLISTSQRGGSILGTVILFPMMMIGGCFFPFEAMPRWMADIGRWTPNGLSVVQLKTMLDGSVQAGSLLQATVCMCVPAVLLFWFCSRLLVTRFVTG